jgi:hypothetical protein
LHDSGDEAVISQITQIETATGGRGLDGAGFLTEGVQSGIEDNLSVGVLTGHPGVLCYSPRAAPYYCDGGRNWEACMSRRREAV